MDEKTLMVWHRRPAGPTPSSGRGSGLTSSLPRMCVEISTAAPAGKRIEAVFAADACQPDGILRGDAPSRGAGRLSGDSGFSPWQERRMEPLFLIIGVLAWGYPQEALHVFGLYVGVLVLKAKLRARRPPRHRFR